MFALVSQNRRRAVDVGLHGQGHGDGTHDMGVIQSLFLRLFGKLCASHLPADPALRERERRFRQVVEAAPNAMVMISRAGGL